MIPFQNNEMVPTVLNSICPETYNDPNWRYVLSCFTHLYWVVNIRTAESPSSFVSLSIRVTSRPCFAASTDIIVGGNWRWSPARTHLARTKVHVKPSLCAQPPSSPQKNKPEEENKRPPSSPPKVKVFQSIEGAQCFGMRDLSYWKIGIHDFGGTGRWYMYSGLSLWKGCRIWRFRDTEFGKCRSKEPISGKESQLN